LNANESVMVLLKDRGKREKIIFPEGDLTRGPEPKGKKNVVELIDIDVGPEGGPQSEGVGYLKIEGYLIPGE
jgi:hypothetical protein